MIGDPDDSLEFARKEAFKVKVLLEAGGVKVELRIGAPNNLGQGQLEGVAPADTSTYSNCCLVANSASYTTRVTGSSTRRL